MEEFGEIDCRRQVGDVMTSERGDGTVGVIFDMDGVLVDSAGAHLESWRLLAAELGESIDESLFAQTFGRQNKDIIPLVFGRTGDDDIRRLADRKESLYRDLVRASPPVVAGAVDLVRSLHEAGAVLAVGSSAPRANVELVLSAMGAEDCFAALVTSELVSRGKPDPEVFEKAAERLGLPPSRCVVIEDAPAGVAAAKAAGARCIGVRLHHSAAELGAADATVARLEELTAERVLSVERMGRGG